MKEKIKELEMIFDAVSAMIFYKDRKNRFIRVNRAFVKMMGIPRKKLEGTLLEEIYPKDQADAYWRDDKKVIRSGKPKKNIIEIMKTKSKTIWVNTEKIPYKDPSGKIIGIIGFSIDITEQKKYEDSLKESQEEFKGVVENIGIGVSLISPKMEALFFNKQMKKWFPKVTLTKKPVCFHRPGKTGRYPNYPSYKTLKDGKIHRETIETCIDKKNVLFKLVSSPIKNNTGDIVGAVEMAEDVTETFRIINSIKSAKEDMELLLTVLPSAVFAVDVNRKVTQWNKKAELLTGYKKEEVLGKKCTKFAHEPCNLGCEIFSKEQKVPIVSREGTIRTKSGEYITILKNADVIRNEKGEIVGGIESFEDITERKIKEENLFQLTRAVEQSPAVVLITDLEGKIQYANPKFTALTGYSLTEVLDKNPRVLKTEAMPDDIYRNMWEKIVAGEAWSGEFYNKKKDGSCYWEAAAISPIKNLENTIIGYVKVAEDITHRKNTEKELVRLASFPELSPNPIIESDFDGKILYMNPGSKITFPGLINDPEQHPIMDVIRSVKKSFRQTSTYLERQIQMDNKWYELDISRVGGRDILRIYVSDITERKKIEELKNDFVSTVSHELRTPLTSIREGISQVLDGILGPTTEKQIEFLSISLEDVDRLKRIIDDLLDISSIESGKMKIKRAVIRVDNVVANVMNIFLVQARAKNISLISNIPKKEITLYADKDKLMQVLINLIGNSLKFTKYGNISVSITDKEKEIECIVSDTGIGISKEDLPKVFGKFQQFNREPGPGEKGTGLGLVISKNIVEIHGGSMRVESELGKGTKFIFTLPKFTDKELLEEKLQHSLKNAAKKGEALSVILFEIKDSEFLRSGKETNKLAYVLHGMSKVVKEKLRNKDDEVIKDAFSITVILPETRKDDAVKLSSRLKMAINEYLAKEYVAEKMGIKCNVSGFPEDGKTPGDLLFRKK